jgi:hypothetical protein
MEKKSKTKKIDRRTRPRHGQTNRETQSQQNRNEKMQTSFLKFFFFRPVFPPNHMGLDASGGVLFRTLCQQGFFFLNEKRSFGQAFFHPCTPPHDDDE